MLQTSPTSLRPGKAAQLKVIRGIDNAYDTREIVQSHGVWHLRNSLYCGTHCSLAMPDHLDTGEAQIAAVYLTLLIGSNKAFNAQPLWGFRPLGVIAAFVGTGLLPATIIHVALAEIEPGQSDHAGHC